MLHFAKQELTDHNQNGSEIILVTKMPFAACRAMVFFGSNAEWPEKMNLTYCVDIKCNYLRKTRTKHAFYFIVFLCRLKRFSFFTFSLQKPFLLNTQFSQIVKYLCEEEPQTNYWCLVAEINILDTVNSS